jgi:hypothetical protein
LDRKFVKKLDAWQGNAASSCGRLVLVVSGLSSLISYVMSMTLLNKTFIEKVDTHRRHFSWHGKKAKKGTIWSGGLGCVDPRIKGAWE